MTDAGAVRSIAISGDTVRLEFSTETLEWSAAALRAQAQSAKETSNARTLWRNPAEIATRPAISHEAYLSDDRALETALAEMASFGFLRLAGAGLAEDELERIVRRFGFIRETNYGRLFEVVVVADPDNLAFTAQALEPHTDNPYRDPVPTLQLLHCIRNAGEGGATFFLDGFALAEWFRTHRADDFVRLARSAVPFAFESSSAELYETRTPIIRLAADGQLSGIRFNHRAMGSVEFGAAETARWYESYIAFAREADAPERRLSVNMKPGDIVIFDNERILHGRDAFSGAMQRLLRGCYADCDGLRATLARLRR